MNKGDIYELKHYRILHDNEYDVDPPAGSDNSKADIEFRSKVNGETIKLEMKEKLAADYAQMNLNYNNSTNKFWIDKTDYYKAEATATESALTMIGVAEELNVIAHANRHWNPSSTNRPERFNPIYNTWTSTTRRPGRLSDIANFKDPPNITGPKVEDAIETYYTTKDTYYIQIQGYGLYHMKKDIRNWGTPGLKDSMSSAEIRLRVKTNDAPKNTWSFLMALKVMGLTKSPLDMDNNVDFTALPFN